MVMSQCLYKTLKREYPDSQLDVMAPNWCLALLERMPEVNRAIPMPLGHGEFELLKRRALGKELAGIYDWAIVQPNSLKSTLIPVFAGIKRRTGWKGESRYLLLNDLRSNKQDFPLMIERYAALAYDKASMTDNSALPDIPWPELKIDQAVRAKAVQRLDLNRDRKILGLCPGAEFGPAKRWPDSHYAEVASEQIKQGWQVWIFGGEKDKAVGELIRQQLPVEAQPYCVNLAGLTSVSEAIDLLSLPRVVVSNDSGLMHVAAAVGRPLVAVYGSSSPKYTPPLGQQVEVLHTDIECRPCFKKTCKFGHIKCLTELLPASVISAIQTLDRE